MARNDGVDRTVARNRDLKTHTTLQNAQAHNERQKEVYSNPDIVDARTSMNVHYKKPTGSYEEMFAEMESQKIISTWGLKPDSTKFCELVFDVNSAYFFNHGGYEFAKRFYADAYEAAVQIVGGEQYILSAVMHADERNRVMTEALGRDVFHYHLHVVYVPVVEKQVLWSKRCKDKSLVGTVKETIMQVSRSKKWASMPALDAGGKPLLTKKGKPVLKPSYSVLQDDFYNAMLAAGYTDLQRGERGSTEEHLTVTQFKVEQEKQRLAELREESREAYNTVNSLEERKVQVENDLCDLSREADDAQARLDKLTPKIKDVEQAADRIFGSVEDLAPKAELLEGAKSYRENKVVPLLKKLRKVFHSMQRRILELKDEVQSLWHKNHSLEADRNYYAQRVDLLEEENTGLREIVGEYQLVRQTLGPMHIDNILSVVRQRKAAERARRAEEEQLEASKLTTQKAAKRAARSKSEWDSR